MANLLDYILVLIISYLLNKYYKNLSAMPNTKSLAKILISNCIFDNHCNLFLCKRTCWPLSILIFVTI